MSRYTTTALTAAGFVLLIAACRSVGRQSVPWEGPVTRQDSVRLTERRLWKLTQELDSIGRVAGNLPLTLDWIVNRPDVTTDAWGHRVLYAPDGLKFELRSPGSDGVLSSSDDIVALGRVGRNLPCEISDEYGDARYEHIVAPCSTSPAVVLPLCPNLIQIDPERTGSPAPDSSALTGHRLIRFARIIDGVGRERGGLPPALNAVPGQPRLPEWGLPDAWGRPVRYTPEGQRFELRSAGPDGRLLTLDDLVVSGQLGHAIPCEFASAAGTIRCDAPPPPCAESVGG